MSTLAVRRATRADVPGIAALVADYATRGDVLPRPAVAIMVTISEWVVGELDGEIVACGALFRYSSSLGEVRTTIVRDDLQGQGAGRAIVAALVDLARECDVPTLFTLTRAAPFFLRLGFVETEKANFPEKVWKDCHLCPLIDACDEVALRLEVGEFETFGEPGRTDESGTAGVIGSIGGVGAIRGPNVPPAVTGASLSIGATSGADRGKGAAGTPAAVTSGGTKPGGESMRERPKVDKVVLAYSGGLDTSVIVPWLRENYGCEVVCFCADLGQGRGELDGLREKALASGAVECFVEDLRDEFARDFLFPMLQSGAVYERQYLMGTSIARPLIAKRQVEVAEAVGANAVAHGCTGKGNDQVRFELTYQAMNPTLEVIAPWREWSIRSREDALEYADAHGVPIESREKSIYSRDRNLWHISHEGGVLENPANPPDEAMFMLTADPLTAPDEPEIVEIGFSDGVPISVNGDSLGPAALIERLNAIAAPHGVGRIDIVENRLVGMKSRGVYETPGGTLLYAAHRELEALCLDRETAHFKEMMALRYAELVYFGQWYHTLRLGLQRFIDETQAGLTGWVRLRLFKGGVSVQGRYSPNSLYREDFATFGLDDVYDQGDAAGFIRLFGLQMKVQAMMEVSGGGKTRYAAPDFSRFKRD